jgi:FixJ family two-component response regulator
MVESCVAYVIDDEALISSIIKACLLREGFQVQTYVSGDLFLKGANLEAPFLLILDKNMPGITGIELIAKLREESRIFEAILVTGYADMESAIHSVKLGLFSYIEKPFNLEHLVATAKGAHAKLQKRLEGSLPSREAVPPGFQAVDVADESLSYLESHLETLNKVAPQSGTATLIQRNLDMALRTVSHLRKLLADQLGKGSAEKEGATEGRSVDLTAILIPLLRGLRPIGGAGPMWVEHLEPVWTKGDRGLLEDALRSFLALALVESRPDGMLLVDLRRAGSQAVVSAVLQDPAGATSAPAALPGELVEKANLLGGELRTSTYLDGAGVELKLLLP